MIRVNYDKNLNIFHEQFIGKFTIDDLVAYHSSEGKDDKLPRKFNVLIDYTEAEFIFDVDDLNKLAGTIKKNVGNYKYIKAAILHFKPYEQAISMMFEDMMGDIANFHTQIFTTKEAAIKWLLLYDVEPVRKKEGSSLK